MNWVSRPSHILQLRVDITRPFGEQQPRIECISKSNTKYFHFFLLGSLRLFFLKVNNLGKFSNSSWVYILTEISSYRKIVVTLLFFSSLVYSATFVILMVVPVVPTNKNKKKKFKITIVLKTWIIQVEINVQ